LHTRPENPFESHALDSGGKMLDNGAANCFLAFKTLAKDSRRSSGISGAVGTIWNTSSLDVGAFKGGEDMYPLHVKGRTALTPWAMKNGDSQSNPQMVTGQPKNVKYCAFSISNIISFSLCSSFPLTCRLNNLLSYASPRVVNSSDSASVFSSKD